jgi:hypothetical protein
MCNHVRMYAMQQQWRRDDCKCTFIVQVIKISTSPIPPAAFPSTTKTERIPLNILKHCSAALNHHHHLRPMSMRCVIRS